MSPRLRVFIVVIAFFVAAVVVACGGGNATPTADSGTMLAQTAQYILTATAAGNVTPAPVTPSPQVPATPQPKPNPNPAATPEPVPVPPSCANDSKFVEDVTVPDGTHFAPKKAFSKTWKIQNTGTCAWTTDYQYKFIGGEQMGGADIKVPNAVQPGETIDLTIKLTAPATAGKYRGQWRLFAPDGTPFGQKPYVDIVVP
ncbi:MAG TPA: NBR1-Ig-like domain-containing protein [Anaerolineae bacterium]